MTFAKTDISLDVDAELLREELVQRGPGIGEKFEEAVVKPLQKLALETYKAIYDTMPVEQQQDCDWIKEQDNAREDMKLYGENGNSEKMRIAVEAGITHQVEDSFMEPQRRRLAQLELQFVLNTEANYTLLEHIDALQRTLKAAKEEKLEDPPLISRGQKRLAEQEAEARRLDAQKELLKSTSLGQKVAQRWELEQKTKKRTHPEVPLLDIPIVKDPKQVTSQEKKEEEIRQQCVKDQQVMVKGLRLAFEEGEEAGCDRDVIDNCRRVYSELRIFTTVKATLHRLAVEQAAQRLAEETARKAAERAAAKEAAREARRQAALERGEDFEESDESDDDAQNKFYDEEEEIEQEDEDPKDIEDGSADTLAAALMRAREIGGKHEIRDFGKGFLQELNEEAYQRYLMREMVFSASKTCAEELQHVLEQVVAAGLGKKSSGKTGQREKDAAKWDAATNEERPGVRRFLPDGDTAQDASQEQQDPESAETPMETTGDQEDERQSAAKQSDLSEATLNQNDDADAEKVSEAKTRLAFLKMRDAMEARDLESLLKLVPGAEAAAVEESEITLGWRLVRELELAVSLKKPDLKEIRMRLRKATEAKVEEETLREAARKLAAAEIREGCRLENIEMLERAIDEGTAAGMTDKQLFMGKQAFLKLQVSMVATTESPEVIGKLLSTAKEMGWPEDHKDLVQPKTRLALLELREAIEGADAEVLQKCVDNAREHRVQIEEVEKGDYRLRILELESATKDYLPERLRDAMMEAKAVSAPKELFLPAKRKLQDLYPEAYTEWMILELEEAVCDLSPEDPSSTLRPVLEEAIKAGVDEGDLRQAEEKLAKMELNEAVTMEDRFDVERILNTAQVYGWDLAQGSVGALYKAADERRQELLLKERKSDCIDNLKFAVISVDLELIRQYLKEAEELGVEDEVIKKAETMYRDYA